MNFVKDNILTEKNVCEKIYNKAENVDQRNVRDVRDIILTVRDVRDIVLTVRVLDVVLIVHVLDVVLIVHVPDVK